MDESSIWLLTRSAVHSAGHLSFFLSLEGALTLTCYSHRRYENCGSFTLNLSVCYKLLGPYSSSNIILPLTDNLMGLWSAIWLVVKALLWYKTQNFHIITLISVNGLRMTLTLLILRSPSASDKIAACYFHFEESKTKKSIKWIVLSYLKLCSNQTHQKGFVQKATKKH